eukprot:scaffold4805_cov136-Cylindrotheca_fusiformis.AAC.7
MTLQGCETSEALPSSCGRSLIGQKGNLGALIRPIGFKGWEEQRNYATQRRHSKTTMECDNFWHSIPNESKPDAIKKNYELKKESHPLLSHLAFGGEVELLVAHPTSPSTMSSILLDREGYRYHHGTGMHYVVQEDEDVNRPKYSLRCCLCYCVDVVVCAIIVGFLVFSFWLSYYLYNNGGD